MNFSIQQKRYADAKQGHVMRFCEKDSSNIELKMFLEQLGEHDPEYVNNIYKATMDGLATESGTGGTLQPCESVTVLSDVPNDQTEAWRNNGLKAVAMQELGVIIMAGGQGTRLKSNRPKGEFNIGLLSKKSLFQLQCERILKLQELAKMNFPEISNVQPKVWLYVMTSPMTDVLKYFKANNNFGLAEDQVVFFKQGTCTFSKLNFFYLFFFRTEFPTAPDGNGGIYRALHGCGSTLGTESPISHMQRKGVSSVLGDPVFVGYCRDRNADVGNKVVSKTNPEEKVGVLCRRSGMNVFKIEYFQYIFFIRNFCDLNGQLTFRAGNVCIHYYSFDFLKNNCAPNNLPRKYHIAKKVFVSKPKKNIFFHIVERNGIKLESFIFDLFPIASNLVVLEVNRENEFSPVKNATGNDSPETARLMTSNLHRKWLIAAGATVVGEDLCEVSAKLSFSGEGLSKLVQGRCYKTPVFLSSDNDCIKKDQSTKVSI
eukprot:GSMAST32.ASY1.ANO1.2261.1 assembled CDS